MADSCREQIVAAALTAIQGAGTGATVERNRRDPLEDGELPHLILFEGPERAEIVFSGEEQYTLSLLFQGAIKGNSAAAAQAANLMRGKIIMALRADVTLGGKARNLEIVDAGDWIGTPTVADDTEGFILQADVIYATAEGDPFTFAH